MTATRSLIQIIQGKVISQTAMAGAFYRLVIDAPAIVRTAQPGQFVHLICDQAMTLRRPFSIFRADPVSGHIELLYRVVGQGTEAMRHWQTGQTVDLMGPLGKPFTLEPVPAHAVLVAGGVGLAPLFFLAERAAKAGIPVSLYLGLELPWPNPVDPIPALWQPWFELVHVLRDNLGISLSLASKIPQSGMFQGYVTDLVGQVLADLPSAAVLFTCGPAPMMAAVARLAQRFHLTGQAALEAHMACGFGGCAGCVVPIRSPKDKDTDSWHYLRACQDGPVFALNHVVWDHYEG